jgi:hypothetical protein
MLKINGEREHSWLALDLNGKTSTFSLSLKLAAGFL